MPDSPAQHTLDTIGVPANDTGEVRRSGHSPDHPDAEPDTREFLYTPEPDSTSAVASQAAVGQGTAPSPGYIERFATEEERAALMKKETDATSEDQILALLRAPEGVDLNEISDFAEYETYGQWMLALHPDEVTREYFFNVGLKRDKLASLDELSQKYASTCNSVSFHTYLN